MPSDVRDRFCRDLEPFLRAAARRGRRSGFEPDDASQEAWVIILARVRHFRAEGETGRFLGWLEVVVHNHLANLERHRAARHEVPLGGEMAATLVGREEDPAAVWERCWIQEAVRSALETARGHIPELSYRILILRWFEDRTFPEIASALGLSATQVRYHHRRVVPILRGLLKRWFDIDSTGLAVAIVDREAADLAPESGEVTP